MNPSHTIIKCRSLDEEEALAWHWHDGAGLIIDDMVGYEKDQAFFSWILRRWRVDPICFAVEALRTKLMPYQAHVLLDLANAPMELYQFYGLDSRNAKLQVLIPSGHGLGKTRTLAVGIWWMLLTHMYSHTLCTAPSSAQLTGRLWGEIRKLYRRLKNHWPDIANDWEIQGSSIVHVNPDYGDWNVVARTARPEKPEALQGAHALDDDNADGQLAEIFHDDEPPPAAGGILVVIEEASGVDDSIRKTLEGALSEEGARLLAPGNPTRPDGWFADDCERTQRYAVHTLDCRQSDRTKTYYLPFRDTSGRVQDLYLCGFVSPQYWENILADCDGDEDADYFRVRVRGLKPRSALLNNIKSYWIDNAQQRKNDEESKAKPPIIGLDFGLTSDKHALAVRQGFNMLHGEEWLPHDEPSQITLEAARKAIDTQEIFKARYIIGDSNGVGRGAMEYLTQYYQEHNSYVRVIHFNAGKGALDNNRYSRRRDEMWHKYGRKWVANPACSLLTIPGLKQQLTAPQYSESNNKIYVESKKDMKKRGIDSTNLADALLMTLMVYAADNDTQQEPKKKSSVVPNIFQKHFDRLRQARQTGTYIR